MTKITTDTLPGKMVSKADKKKRVLVVHSGGSSLRGSELQILETINVLKNDGREVYLVCDQPIMMQAAKQRDIPCELLNCAEFMIDGSYLQLNLFGLIKSNLKVARTVKKHTIQVVYSNTGRANQMSYLGARLTGVPVICHVHCFYNYRYLKLYMINLADITIHCSQAIASQNESKLHSKKCEVVLNGIDFSRLTWDSPDYSAREAIGIPSESIVLGYLGAVISSKGVDVLFKAFANLKQHRNDIRLVLGGEGDINQYIKLAEELDIADHVVFLGHVEKPDTFFRNLIDIHIMPSPVESFGRTVVEAAACGVYSIAANAGGLREAMLGGAFGKFFDPGDHNSLAQAIVAMIDSDLWRSKCKRIRELAETEFEINRSTAKIINLLDKL